MTDARLPPDAQSPEYMPHGHAGASVEYWKARALTAEAELADADRLLKRLRGLGRTT